MKLDFFVLFNCWGVVDGVECKLINVGGWDDCVEGIVVFVVFLDEFLGVFL